MMSRAERQLLQKELQENLPFVSSKLLSIQNVVGVGIGFKQSAGKLTDEISYRVYVKQKLEEANLPAGQLIPKYAAGHKTDVVMVPNAVKRLNTDNYRPLNAGIAIGPKDSGVGTLGWFGTAPGDKKVILTNHHVAMPGDDPAAFYKLGTDEQGLGEIKIGQPFHRKFSNCCCDCDVIGKVLVAKNDEHVDCALIQIDSEFANDTVLEIFNNDTEEVLTVSGVGAPVCGDKVFKIGIRSGHTVGFIAEIGGVCRVVPELVETTMMEPGEAGYKSGQIFIYPDPEETYSYNDIQAFSYKGDSGSAIINENGEIVGLLWGGDNIKREADDSDLDVTFACTIQSILSAFSDAGLPVTISETPTDNGAIASARQSLRQNMKPYSSENSALYFRWQLSKTDFGVLLLQMLDKHEQEILHLVNHCRAVTVAWQRNRGPAFLAHFLKNIRNADHKIPQNIDGVTIENLLVQMHEALLENGSEPLCRDLEQYAFDLIVVLSECRTMAEMMDRFRETAVSL